MTLSRNIYKKVFKTLNLPIISGLLNNGGILFVEVRFLKSRKEFSWSPWRLPEGDRLSALMDPRVNLSSCVDNLDAKLDFLLLTAPFLFGVSNIPPS